MTDNSITTNHVHRNDSPDSLELGTPSRGGAIKVYGDFNQPDLFKVKIDNAFVVRSYANQKMEES